MKLTEGNRIHWRLSLFTSPFTTVVEPGVDASRVRVSGPGVQDNIPASLPVTFLIDTREAGIADLEVLIKVRLKVQKCGDEDRTFRRSTLSAFTFALFSFKKIQE